jgi:Holliday junction DNA helicase RuvA
MYDYLSGTVARIAPYAAVIDVNGVGYLCNVSLSTQSRLVVDKPARLHTWLYLREGIMDLFGFHDPRERDCFLMLLGITGVGPKAALSLLSALTPERLAIAVMTGDEKALTAAAGVGKKLAQRILLELKDKLGAGKQGGMAGLVETGGHGIPPLQGNEGKLQEALGALAVLGYTPSEAAMAIKGIDIAATGLEDIIKVALGNMVR